MVEPQTLVVGVEERFVDQVEFVVEHLLSRLVSCVFLRQQPDEELSAVVPGGEIGEVALDHFRRIVEFVAGHGGLG